MERLAIRTLVVGGSLLLVVAAIHLAVTSELREFFLRSSRSDQSMRFWLAPFLLNHVVVASPLRRAQSRRERYGGGCRCPR